MSSAYGRLHFSHDSKRGEWSSKTLPPEGSSASVIGQRTNERWILDRLQWDVSVTVIKSRHLFMNYHGRCRFPTLPLVVVIWRLLALTTQLVNARRICMSTCTFPPSGRSRLNWGCSHSGTEDLEMSYRDGYLGRPTGRKKKLTSYIFRSERPWNGLETLLNSRNCQAFRWWERKVNTCVRSDYMDSW